MIVRLATAEDGPALAALAAAGRDGGAGPFSAEQHVPADQIPREHEVSEHFVAEVDGVLAGTAWLDLGRCRFEGEDARYALLSTLQVDPAYRQFEVAAELTERRLDRARELAGDDVVTVAYLQAGNRTALANAQQWATQTGGQLIVTPVPVRRRPPRPAPGLTVRPAAEAELDEIAAAIGTFYASHDFARYWDAARLAEWLAASPLPGPVNHYRVVTDASGRLLAGLGLHEQGRLTSLVVRRLPLPLLAANAVAHVVPRGGRMRNLVIDKAWYAPGQLDAARYLWETTRWEWRDAGTSLLLPHDPRSPVHPMTAGRPGLLTTSLIVAVNSARPMREETIVEQL